jgi:glutamate N-acetyltransferase/amino-acid N-acetyltransferase
MIKGDITAPKGFYTSSVHANIRKNPNQLDLALIFSKVPAVSVGVFTQNKVKAAPVMLTQKNIEKGLLQAIVVNSGNANACTGLTGMLHATQMIQSVAKELNCDPDHVAVASTGVIGVPLPIDNIKNGIKAAAQKIEANENHAALAIMTTDTFAKSISVEILLDNVAVKIGAIAKGSGMIHPNMATMLAFITSDIAITQNALQQALNVANQSSFNMISVDGDTSTNDMVLMMANGLAANNPILSADDPRWSIFTEALTFICKELAKQIAKDGEGASKFIEVHVKGALNETEAQLAARSICSSPLVKAAFYGADANWGRIACAIGSSGAEFNLNQICIEIAGITCFANGEPIPMDENHAKKALLQDNIFIQVDLGKGTQSATAWGCDLTPQYISINSNYRS